MVIERIILAQNRPIVSKLVGKWFQVVTSIPEEKATYEAFRAVRQLLLPMFDPRKESPASTRVNQIRQELIYQFHR